MPLSDRPRVLVLASTFPRWRGDSLPDFVERLTEHLAGNFRITVLAPHYPGSRTVERWKNFGVVRYRYFFAQHEKLAYGGGLLPNVRRFPLLLLLLPFFFSAGVFACCRLLRNRKFSLLHAHWIVPQGAMARLAKLLMRQSLPVLVTSHGGDLWAMHGNGGRMVKRWVLSGCAGATVVSSPMKSQIRELAPGLPTTVIPMGTEMDRFFAPAIPAPLNHLLFVGRLTEKKGANIAIQALSFLHDNDSLRLTIVGDGPLRKPLIATARELDVSERITFKGWVDREQLLAIFHEHGIFLFPSIITKDGDQEGLGLTLVEAMASGCTIIASSLPAVADLVTNKKTGLTFPPGDYRALATCIDMLLSDEGTARQLSSNAREHVLENFSMPNSSAAFHRVYEDLI